MLGAAEQRAVLNACLRGAPYRLVFAADGEDGWDRFRESQPDLVLSHLKTARLDGTILCHLIVQESQGAVGVILFGDEPIARGSKHAEAVGARAYLSADVLQDRLLATVARVLSEPAPRKAKAPEPAPEPVADALPRVDDAAFSAESNLGYAGERRGDDEVTNATGTPVLGEIEPEVRLERAPDTTTTMSAVHQAMIEELPLPSAGHLSTGGASASALVRESPDDLIQELPRDATPSLVSPRQAAGAGGRKGLDESQLGKRLVRRVQQVHEKLETLDYYQLLGVERDATPAQLRAAYFELSLEFHPDRFFLLRSGGTKEKIYAIFRRVSEAYAVLSDERRRAIYDEHGSAPLPRPSVPSIPAVTTRPGVALDPRLSPPELKLDAVTSHAGARRYLQLANVALKVDEFEEARLMLAFAVGLDTQSASLRRVLDGVAKRQSEAVRARFRLGGDPDATLSE